MQRTLKKEEHGEGGKREGKKGRTSQFPQSHTDAARHLRWKQHPPFQHRTSAIVRGGRQLRLPGSHDLLPIWCDVDGGDRMSIRVAARRNTGEGGGKKRRESEGEGGRKGEEERGVRKEGKGQRDDEDHSPFNSRRSP
eukprot:2720626-Rhodomonas_salina.2